MTRRHYGIRVPRARPTSTGPDRAGAWSGDAFIWAIVVILICPRCRSLWGEQDRHRRCEHHRLVSTPNDRQSKPSTVGTSHDASWTRQGLHGICKPRGANPSNCPPKRLKPSELRAVDHAAPRDRDVQLSPAADRLWHMLWPASWPTRHHQKNQI
jgi:hypothetical protein